MKDATRQILFHASTYRHTQRRVLKVVLFANANAFEKAVSIWKQLDGVDKPGEEEEEGRREGGTNISLRGKQGLR